MQRDPRYDILFEPVRIGPVTAKNRFFQVPHCNGMGHAMPEAHAAMRAAKAEGGWAVVSTEECEIHPTGDISPYVEARLWDDHDIPALALMCEKVHAHGALAAIELTHNGPTSSNLYSREVAIAPSHQPLKYGYPQQARAMTLRDIRDYRRWHRDAALRAKRAGFDIVYIYAAHDLSLAMHFLQQRRNHRSDEYGGSLENRVRLLRELISDTKEAVGDKCAVAVRFATEEFIGVDGVRESEAREIVHMLADLPDLWDVNIAAWHMDSQTSRFADEGYQEPFTGWVKSITRKPVVGVGRFTSPDTMVGQIRRGVLDFIGAARPSIADPFLPRKIEEGRVEDIRECIGCNICVTGDMTVHADPLHAEPDDGRGMAQGLASGTHRAEQEQQARAGRGRRPGGTGSGARARSARLRSASRRSFARARRPREPRSAPARTRAVGARARLARHPAAKDGERRDLSRERHQRRRRARVRRGARRAGDGLSLAARRLRQEQRRGDSRLRFRPRVHAGRSACAGAFRDGPVLLFDDDAFYIGSVMAEVLRAAGREVVYVTPDDVVASWTTYTQEYRHVQKRLRSLGMQIVTGHNIRAVDSEGAQLVCVYSGREQRVACASIVAVTARLPNDSLQNGLLEALAADWQAAGIEAVTPIGDCHAPGLIVHAVYAGHRYARELDEPAEGEVCFRRRASQPPMT